MKLTKKQIMLTVICAILCVLIITNPSTKAFKEYVGISTYNGLHKKSNLFICSVYHNEYNQREYVGFLGNFFCLPVGKKYDSIKHDTVFVDSNKQWTAPSTDELLPPPPNKHLKKYTSQLDTVKHYDEYGILIRNSTRLLIPPPIGSKLLYDTVENSQKSFYNSLIAIGYKENQIGSLKEFLIAIRYHNKASKLYDLLSKDGVTSSMIGTKQEFIRRMMNNKL